MNKLLSTALLAGMLFMPIVGAKTIDETLGYAVTATEGHIQLTLDGAKSPAMLTSVALLLPNSDSQDVVRRTVPLTKPILISPKAVVDLGSILAVSQIIAPHRKISDVSLTASEEPSGCASCSSVPFAIQFQVDYSDGTKKDILTGAYVRYPMP